jgi:hypothetical protein
LLQGIAAWNNRKRDEQGGQHGGDRCDHVLAGVVEAEHVGAEFVAIDQIQGDDKQATRHHERCDDQAMELVDAACHADGVEGQGQRKHIE